MTERLWRGIRWFEKDPADVFVGEAEFRDLSLDALQELFEVDKDDPMYGCFPVAARHTAKLEGHVDVAIDLAAYDYFVECNSLDEHDNLE